MWASGWAPPIEPTDLDCLSVRLVKTLSAAKEFVRERVLAMLAAAGLTALLAYLIGEINGLAGSDFTMLFLGLMVTLTGAAYSIAAIITSALKCSKAAASFNRMATLLGFVGAGIAIAGAYAFADSTAAQSAEAPATIALTGDDVDFFLQLIFGVAAFGIAIRLVLFWLSRPSSK